LEEEEEEEGEEDDDDEYFQFHNRREMFVFIKIKCTRKPTNLTLIQWQFYWW
jgi:hypothetical protein